MEGDAQEQLADMARRGARLTHPLGNRRFHGWWLRIEQGVVVAVGQMNPEPLTPAPVVQDDRTDQEKRQAKLRVEKAIALHFPRKTPTK